MIDRLRIATRESKLALWQANHLKGLLEAVHPGLKVEVAGMSTQGDRNKKDPLSRMGGKGVFVKELEQALLDGEVELALHCMKDMPSHLPEGLVIEHMLEREDPRDAFVSDRYASFAELPSGAKIGSSSLRRRLQLKQRRDDLEYLELRGNVDTRLAKLKQGDYDAIILAAAGLKRMDLEQQISEYLTTDLSLPSVGQGALGIEIREGDADVATLLAPLNHADTVTCVNVERQVSIGLGADCTLPIAAHAVMEAGEIKLSAYLSNIDGSEFLRLADQSKPEEGIAMAQNLVAKLLAEGGEALIASHGT